MHALMKVIQKRNGLDFYREYSLHASLAGIKPVPVAQLLGSEFEENKVIFNKAEDDKLIAYQEKRLKEMQVNGR